MALVERRDLEIRAEAAGVVEPVRVVEVKSKASGEILQLHVETGDDVGQGALLAEIDPRDVRNALAQAEADLQVARANVETTAAQRRRMEELRRANVVTEEEYESAALGDANARAQLVKARTNLELARERMGDVTIRAPIAGTIIEKSVEIGQIIASASANVSGGTTLLRMADLSEVQVRTLVDETDIGRIAAGQEARVAVEPYPGRPFLGRVLKIEPQAVVEQNVTMFPVLVRLDNREGLLKPGMNAEVEIEVARREDAVVVPNAAVSGLREAVSAGAALGLDEETLRTALRSGRSGAPGGGTRAGGRRVAARSSGGGTAPGSTARPDDPPGESDATSRGRNLTAGGASATVAASAPRPGVVFVARPEGPEPRVVALGLNDWDYTEVLRGLEPGERVVLISVARLQQQQQEFQERVRQRTGNPFTGGQSEGGRTGGAGGGAGGGGAGGGGGGGRP